MKKIAVALLLCLISRYSEAQIVNDTIFVNTNSVVEITFPSPPEATLSRGDGSFEVDGGKKKSLLLKARTKDPEAEKLTVTEGSRTHTFVLAYSENVLVKIIDYSSSKKLNQHIKDNTEKLTKNLTEARQLFDNGQFEVAMARYQRLFYDAQGSEQAFINNQIKECEARLRVTNERNYTDAVARGDELVAKENFLAADAAYREALTYKAGDQIANSKLQSNLIVGFDDYLQKGDKATRTGNAILGKQFYEEAKKFYPQGWEKKHEKKYLTLIADADKQAYSQHKMKGDDAFELKNWPAAIQSFDSALFYKKDNAYCLGQIKKAKQEMARSEKKRQDEAEYFRLLSKAKKMSGLASTGRDYEQAIADYRAALALFPTRKFPKDKIDELTKMKNSLAVKNR